MVHRVALSSLIAILCIQMGGWRAIATSRDELYNSIFLISSEKLEPLDVRVRLNEMDSQVWGLEWDDPRRVHVLFWLEASINKVEKCNLYDEHLLASRLESHKEHALREAERQNNPDAKGGIFNLETYADDLRTERLLFCEFRIGKSFIEELDRGSANKIADVDRLANIYLNSGRSSVDALGRRVSNLIAHNSDQIVYDKLRQSEDKANFVRIHFLKHSACSKILDVTRKYNSYYGLLLFAGEYPQMSQQLRHWLGRISACVFIDETWQVYQAAALLLSNRHNPNRSKFTKTRSLKKILEEEDDKIPRSTSRPDPVGFIND